MLGASESELIVVGCVLTEPECVTAGRATGLSPQEFADTSLGEILTATAEFAPEDCNPVAVGRVLKRRGTLKRVGGWPRLNDLWNIGLARSWYRWLDGDEEWLPPDRLAHLARHHARAVRAAAWARGVPGAPDVPAGRRPLWPRPITALVGDCP